MFWRKVSRNSGSIFIAMLGLPLVLLAGCATTAPKEPQIERISAEELEQIMPKPVPNLTLDEIVKLSKDGVTADQIIEKIKASNSRYDLTPSETLALSKRGVDTKVLDYMHVSREQALRESFADEINKREKEKKLEQNRLRREYRSRSSYYDPFWGYGYSPYYRHYGPGYRHYGPGFGTGFGFGYRRGW